MTETTFRERVAYTVHHGVRGQRVHERLLEACKLAGVKVFTGGSMTYNTRCINLLLDDAEAFNALVLEACSEVESIRFSGEKTRPVDRLGTEWNNAVSRTDGWPVYDVMVEEHLCDGAVPVQRMFSRIQSKHTGNPLYTGVI